MKKIMVMILFLFILINLEEARASTPYKKINKNVFKEAIQALVSASGDWDKTIMKIAMYAKYKFTYRSDESLFGEIDYWQSAEEMFDREEGDCDDYAGFFQGALRVVGISSAAGYVVWSRAPKLFCHAIVVVPFKNGWATLDSSREVINSFSSKEKAIDGITEKYGYAVGGNIPVEYPDYAYETRKVKSAEKSQRLKMHSHLTECAPNQIELMIPTINDEKDYCALQNKEAVGVLIKTRKNFLSLEAVGLSFAMFGWYSPRIEYNDKMYTAHFLFPYVGFNVYTGDYKGVDIDVNPINLNWFKTYVCCRNFGEVWDYKAILKPIKFFDIVGEMNDGDLSYGIYFNFLEEKDSIARVGYSRAQFSNEKEISIELETFNPSRRIKMTIGSYFRAEIGFGW